MLQVTLEEANARLNELVEAASGEEVYISRQNGLPVQLVLRHTYAQEPKRKKRQFGSAKGLITMAPDFDAPLDDFKEYIE